MMLIAVKMVANKTLIALCFLLISWNLFLMTENIISKGQFLVLSKNFWKNSICRSTGWRELKLNVKMQRENCEFKWLSSLSHSHSPSCSVIFSDCNPGIPNPGIPGSRSFLPILNLGIGGVPILQFRDYKNKLKS